MKAIIKSDKKIIINQVDNTEKALIENFVKRSISYKTEVKELYDINAKLDGYSFKLLESEQKSIPYKEQYLQVLNVGGSTSLDLGLPENTEVLINAPSELKVNFSENKLNIEALDVKKENVSVQYVITLTLTHESYAKTILPIYVAVLYSKNGSGVTDYTELDNLPTINEKTVIGKLKSEDLKLQGEMKKITNSQIEELFRDIIV